MTETAPSIPAVELTDNDIAYVLTLLRNATSPFTTQQLVQALRNPTDR
ncbi:MAG: hypothetical protein M3121_06990 [Chloroflexota bacterium]|nr:hypothetical protein [Chloroflexota bacterium]